MRRHHSVDRGPRSRRTAVAQPGQTTRELAQAPPAGRHEIDLLVERRDHRVLTMEVKLRQTVSDADVQHLAWPEKALGPELLDAVVITTGPHAYRRADGIAVVPAAVLGP